MTTLDSCLAEKLAEHLGLYFVGDDPQPLDGHPLTVARRRPSASVPATLRLLGAPAAVQMLSKLPFYGPAA
jgi:hypothetical protein